MSEDLIARSLALAKKGSYNECIELLSRAPGRLNGAVEKSYKHDAWYLIGDCYFQMSRYALAVKAFLRALKERAGDRDTIFAIGNCYSHLNAPSRARWYFGYLSDLDQHDFEALYNLGNCWVDLGNDVEALNCFRKVSTSNSECASMAKKNMIKIDRRMQERTKS